jgi:hypothetical protein
MADEENRDPNLLMCTEEQCRSVNGFNKFKLGHVQCNVCKKTGTIKEFQNAYHNYYSEKGQ